MTAVITGASSGIGRAFAERLAAAGHDLVLAGRRRDVLGEVATGIRRRSGVEVTLVVGDLATPDVETKLAQLITETRPAILINNAGSGLGAEFATVSPDRITTLTNLLLTVPARLIRSAAPAMAAAGRGTIINVGSLAGRLAVPGSSVYVAAKSALERLSESLALELAPEGIVVQALLPGYVRTDFQRDVPDYRSKQRSHGFIRWMEPEAVVNASLKAAERARNRLSQVLKRGGAGSFSPRARDVVVIAGFTNRFLTGVSRFIPRGVLYRAASGHSRLS